ncbi:hypothetical protein ACKVMY_03075 [Vibrio natriegens]|nr:MULTISPECIES: hypothetical protein [Vibrio]
MLLAVKSGAPAMTDHKRWLNAINPIYYWAQLSPEVSFLTHPD